MIQPPYDGGRSEDSESFSKFLFETLREAGIAPATPDIDLLSDFPRYGLARPASLTEGLSVLKAEFPIPCKTREADDWYPLHAKRLADWHGQRIDWNARGSAWCLRLLAPAGRRWRCKHADPDAICPCCTNRTYEHNPVWEALSRMQDHYHKCWQPI